MATIDLSRFQATFFAESREGLDAMETGVLALESGGADTETINTIFRAAHSIKGGSATFGFRAIADTTHLLETLLDKVRAGQRRADADISDALLQSVDVLRGMLARAEDGKPDVHGDEALNQRLSALLAVGAVTIEPVVAVRERHSRWHIRFAPHASIFGSGNDPLRIIRELATLGPLKTTCDLSKLPSLKRLDPTQNYLSWDFELDADIERRKIEDVFSWVEDECELAIEGLRPAVSDAATAEEPLKVPIPVAEPSAAAKTTAPARTQDAHADGDGSIRVAIAKVDSLINLVGELVITQAMLRQQSSLLDPGVHNRLVTGLAQLERNTRDLQDAVMGVRMMPVEFVFSRFPRLVRDLAGRLNKKVRLVTTGESTELDKGVIERIVDPLTHLVRNAVDHGLESPESRADDGKDPTGVVTLAASHQGGHILIDVTDDGRGLDRERILAKAAERGLAIGSAPTDAEVWQLIFHPGLSTADAVTDVSGRGVGMDVVRQNILALGGEVEVDSHRGRGTRVRIRLPLTLAIVDGMSVSVGGEIFILPLAYVVESLQPANDDIKRIAGRHTVLRVRGEHLPLLRLGQLFGTADNHGSGDHGGIVVVVESEGRKLALAIDELVGQQQFVVKSIESNYRRIHGVSGATILGDGRVALIVDVSGLTRASASAA